MTEPAAAVDEPRRWSRLDAVGVVLLAALAYLPSLLSSPGRMPADTKLYLYLDPGRLIADAPWTFDGRQFAGWVPHQTIAYLWPQGPWFWSFDLLGVPDWVAHRLWIGTLLFLAGFGVGWLARRFGLSPAAALAAAVVYALSPYLLPYVSRTSAMLLPWAGLPWIVGLTALAATRSRWRHAALAALVVASVGAVNATALLMIAPGPALWLAIAALERRITWRRAGVTAAKVGGLSVAVSLWWMAAVVIQGRSGADVLAFSESLESVSFTSTSAEVWRGMGYWLDYVRDGYAPTTTAAAEHMVSLRVIAAGYVLVLLGVAGLVLTRWRSRRFAIALVVTGVVLGVGVHPFDDPSPVMALLRGDGTSGAALALRSSTRAVPLVLLGLGLGVGSLLDAAGARLGARRDGRTPVVALAGAGAVLVVALVSLPSLIDRRLVDPALDRDEDPPPAWLEAAAALDAQPPGYRVLQLPGQEFGAFRWGYTVDPPLPGLTARPLVTRDLLPLGSGPAMDLLYALDDRFQAGTIERTAIAPVARLLGADTIWVTGDAAFDRFRTPRPELVQELFTAAGDGLGRPTAFGTPTVNLPDVPMLDETALSEPAVGTAVAPVLLVPVEDPVPVIRAGDEEVLITGSGDGLVDAAAVGLLDGHEIVRYTGSLEPDERRGAVAAASRVIRTDTHRRRAHHWRGSQDVTGFTEWDTTDQPELAVDTADERLAVFERDAAVTDAVQVGPVRAWATGYGEPFAYRPEHRPFMAVDGRLDTAWVVADRADPIGEMLQLRADGPIDHLSLRQPDGAAATRHLARVEIVVDDGPPIPVVLDERSLTGAGQRVEIEPTAAPVTVGITITEVVVPPAPVGLDRAAVGFAEVDLGLGPTREVVRLADDLGADLNAATPLTYVFTRERVDPRNRWRDDPEPAMTRAWRQTDPDTVTPEITVRLDRRADDAVLADVLGVAGTTADRRLAGVPAAAGWAATDGDGDTAWIGPFGPAVGTTLRLTADRSLERFTLRQPAGDYSRITAVRVAGAAVAHDAVVNAGPDGAATITLPQALPAGPITIEITGVDERTTIDRRYAEPVALPVAISELSIGRRTPVPATVDTGCRDDLVAIDGAPLPIRITASSADLLAGTAVAATLCADPAVELAAGDHELVTTPGTGLDVDRVVLDAGGRSAAAAGSSVDAGPAATVDASSRLARTVTVRDCPAGCWLVLGEGFHEAWAASIDGTDLGTPALVDGGFNGWRIPAREGATTVELRWTAQRPLDVALALSVLAVLACLVLALLDRRPIELPAPAPGPRLTWTDPPTTGRRRLLPIAVWVVGAALLVQPGWGLVAAFAGVVLVSVCGQPRWAGLVTLVLLAVIALGVLWIVRRDRPWPDAGWPVRFERLHELGLFAAVSLAVAACTPPREAT
jgi:arabinofuranan 3-O-arabinosyltransferase